MNTKLLASIKQLNPWMHDPQAKIFDVEPYYPRIQIDDLLEQEWDSLWTILVGPRRAGKTTLGKCLCNQLIQQKRYQQLLYLNCDYLEIRRWLESPVFLTEAIETLKLSSFILFIDEVQRLTTPGLLLKAIIDLGLPIKHIATGSSQLEIRSKVQEHLTGRQHTALVLPLSHEEWPDNTKISDYLLYGSYPQVIKSSKKEIQIADLYNRYVQKDVIEILKIGQPDVMQNLITLIAHQSGQLTNYNQLATDCKVSVTTIRNYLDILEQTYVLVKMTPFVGNKRVEITSNPIYYFIDNGFRNHALRNFSELDSRIDLGLLVENFIFQEIYKFRAEHNLYFDIHYWRTKSGAEVDFVLYKNQEEFIPIEVKYRNMSKPTITRGFRSFIQAYKPKIAITVTKELITTIEIDGCKIHFVPLECLNKLFNIFKETMS